MQRPAEDEGYEPDSAICLAQDTDPSDLLTDSTDGLRHDLPSGREQPTQETMTMTKRKFHDGDMAQDTDVSPKRYRLDGAQDDARAADSDDSWQRTGERLPAEIWQHVFTFLSPRDLCSLLAVNRLCYGLLHPSPHPGLQTSSAVSSSPSPIVALLEPDHIWQTSRRLFHPYMPAPLKGKTELDMWRIACGRACQFCGSEGATASGHQVGGHTDTWHRGPGAKGVSPVFPFAVVSCGPCLVERSVKELELILSSVPSALHPALPAVFLTSDLHVISPATLQRSDELSIPEKPSKVYWPEHIEQIRLEFESVRSLGAAAAEEWLKGMDARGKKALVDASRWEKFDLSGGLTRLRDSLLPIATSRTAKSSSGVSGTQLREDSSLQVLKPAEADNPAKPTALSENGIAREHESKRMPGCIPGLSIAPPRRKDSPTLLEAAGLQNTEAGRRAEIERRAAWLTPPITPGVLAHLPAFKAAVQISSPLEDQEWKMLSARLLAQRVDTEKQAGLAVAEAATAPTLQEVPDKLWDEAQGPLRARLLRYAEDLISEQWEDGEKVSKKTSARFAVETLLHVRKCFYAEVQKDAAAALAKGQNPIADPPEGPWTQKLTLENMKWLFDLKIRPLTEKHKKEPFFCNGCTQTKTFGLEGVIQHYAAKHDNSLSRGNVVVFWRAEWPAVSPFSPDSTRPGFSLPSKKERQANAASDAQHLAQMQAGHQGLQPPLSAVRYGAPPSGPAVASGGRQAAQLAVQSSSSPQTGDGIPGLHLAPAVKNHPAMQATVQVAKQLPTDSLSDRVSRKRLRARMLEVAQRTWSIIAPTQALGSVKVAILIHHVAKTVQQQFDMAAPLDLFVECIQQLQLPIPAGSVKKLKCKACDLLPSTNLTGLLSHFNNSHTMNGKRNKRKAIGDWRTDMVELPPMEQLSKLPQQLELGRKSKQLALTRKAYQLAMDAMPWAFDQDATYDKGPLTTSQVANAQQAQEPIAFVDRTRRPGGLDAVDTLREEIHYEPPSYSQSMADFQPWPAASSTGSVVPTGPRLQGHVRPAGAPNHRSVYQTTAPVTQAATATSQHDEAMEEADDHYSPPPPEAYQTKGPSQTVGHTSFEEQSQRHKQAATTSAWATQGKSKVPDQAQAAPRPSSYYHQSERPNLRPAKEVYTRAQHRHNVDASRTVEAGVSQLPTSRASQQRPDQSTSGGQRLRDQGAGELPQRQRNREEAKYDPRNAHSTGHHHHMQQRGATATQMPDIPPAYRGQGHHYAEQSGLHRQRSKSPRRDRQHHYRDRSPHQQPSEDYNPAEPVDYQNRSGYEVIRVRDPAGDYLIRRPMPQGAYVHAFGGPPQPPFLMGHPLPPQYFDPYGGPAYFPDFQRAPTAAPVPPFQFQRATTMAPPSYGRPEVYDGYDPRDAARMPPQPRQRYGTESRY
ncbi:f-box domain containing protein [Sarocladium implicatum]|nr:f-box domain containing protein [Sarocladium implicatum]